MTVVDRFRRAADYGRRVADALGQRPITVTVVVETYSLPVGTSSAALTSTQTTTLSPSPKVVFDGESESAFGGGAYSGADGDLQSATVRIGPITQAYAGGGYALAQLSPEIAGPHQRTYLLLMGAGLSSGGERYMVTKVVGDGPQSIVVHAERTQQT